MAMHKKAEFASLIGALLLAVAVAVAVAIAPLCAHAQQRLSLQQAIDLARSRRPEVTAADLDVRLARLELQRAGLSRVRLSLDGRFGEQAERLYVNASPQLCATIDDLCQPAHRTRRVDLAANLVVPLWTGLRLESEWSRARQLERAAAAKKQSRLRSLGLEVATAYWNLRLGELQRDAATRALQRRTAMAELLAARVQAGLAPRPDRDRAETSRLRQQAALAELTGRVEQARAELAAVLQSDQAVVLTDDPGAAAISLPPLATLLAEAEARPELEIARAELAAQEQTVRAIRGDLWPHLELFAQADVQNEAFGVPQPGLIGHFIGGIQARWLLFDNLQTWQASRVADVERSRRALELQRAQHLGRAELRAAHARLAAALQAREPLSRGLTLAHGTLDLVRRRYHSGAAILVEVLDAEQELAELESQVADNAVETALAQAALDATRGRL